MSKASTPTEVELRQKLEGLSLQRARVLQEIASSRNPRYQEMLKEMLRHLDGEIRMLEFPESSSV